MIFGEDDSQPRQPQGGQQQRQQQIRLDISQMDTSYANFFAITGSPDEIVVYLGANSPLPNVAEPIVRLSNRVMLLPQNAKRLLMALQETVKQHEDRFGPIEIGPMPRPPQQGQK
ncbi:hypothetical protein RAS1_21780 [Phycisphaerae bacterium RAS1]|nr:hypothetical protein RAS1_21780 [Phycisphaerae bacterium RAS1]